MLLTGEAVCRLYTGWSEAWLAATPEQRAARAGSPGIGQSHEMLAWLGDHHIALFAELWKLDELAQACAADGVYECMLVAKPLNLVGGVGSPPNAVAIK